jgi:NADPH:quinone reductase-like Zn-dependent oxidoreductase
MKAIVCPTYGPPEVLELRNVPKPVPKDNEILIRNYATTILMGDCEVRGFSFPHLSTGLRFLMRLGFGIKGPRKEILGQQLAGVVEEIGTNVTKFKPGDEVFACTGFGLGAYAEYKKISEKGIVALKPQNMSFEEASTIPVGGNEAYHFLKKARIQSGHKVLINGAGGSIGIIAVQLAKHYGAEVTAVDSNGKFEMLKSLGADSCINYMQDDFWEYDDTYDVIFDVVGVTPFAAAMKSLNENGIYLQGNGSISRSNKTIAKGSNKLVFDNPADYSVDQLNNLRELIEERRIRTFIDRTYNLEEMVEAHRFVESGGKRGNAVVTIQ